MNRPDFTSFYVLVAAASLASVASCGKDEPKLPNIATPTPTTTAAPSAKITSISQSVKADSAATLKAGDTSVAFLAGTFATDVTVSVSEGSSAPRAFLTAELGLPASIKVNSVGLPVVVSAPVGTVAAKEFTLILPQPSAPAETQLTSKPVNLVVFYRDLKADGNVVVGVLPGEKVTAAGTGIQVNTKLFGWYQVGIVSTKIASTESPAKFQIQTKADAAKSPNPIPVAVISDVKPAPAPPSVPVPAPAISYDGTWLSSCQGDTGDDHFDESQIVSGTTWEMRASTWEGNSCAAPSVMVDKMRIIRSFVKSADQANVPVGYERLTFTHVTTLLTYGTQAAVDDVNGNMICGKSNWAVGVEQECTEPEGAYDRLVKVAGTQMLVRTTAEHSDETFTKQ